MKYLIMSIMFIKRALSSYMFIKISILIDFLMNLDLWIYISSVGSDLKN
jgi:hypothetical protein